MITLYQYPPAFDLPISVSPFCGKLEAYLRLTGRTYQTAKANPPRAPEGLVPYIDRGRGMEGDSQRIIESLEAEGPALDGDLDADQRARGDALREAVEDPLYFALLYTRFGDDAGWQHQAGAVKAVLPWFLGLLTGFIRRSQVKKCAAHGISDATDAAREGVAVVRRLSEALGDQPFLLGEVPHVVDCSAWAHVLQAAHTRFENPLTEAVRGDPALGAWLERMNTRLDLTVPAPRYA